MTFPTDSDGNAQGNGCVLDLDTAKKLYPDMGFDEVIERYHDEADNLFKAAFDAAAVRNQHLLEQAGDAIRPGSEVSRNTSYGAGLS